MVVSGHALVSTNRLNDGNAPPCTSSSGSIDRLVALCEPREFVTDPSTVIVHAGDSICVRDVHCSGCQREISAEECPGTTLIVFPYRDAFVRHLGMRQAVADANHVLYRADRQA